MKRTLLIAAALAALLATATLTAAQEAVDCEAPLGKLRTELTALQEKLSAAEASGNGCTSEAASLRDKLQQAEASLTSSAQAAQELQQKLDAAQAALAAAPNQAAFEEERQRLQADAKVASDLLSATRLKLEAAEAEARAAQTRLEELQNELEVQKNDVSGLQRNTEQARIAIANCQAKRDELTAAAEDAAKQVEKHRAEAEAAIQRLAELQTAWLPPWAAKSAGPALARAGLLARQVTQQGSKAAQQAWSSQARPLLQHTITFAQDKAAQLNVAIEARAGESWPKARAAFGAAASKAASAAASVAAVAKRAALAAWNSEAVARVRPALVAGSARLAEGWSKVQGELEELLIRLLGKSNNTAPLARRPYVTYLVYAALVVPLVAFGMPLLGLRRTRTPANGGKNNHPMTTRRKKKGGRIREGTDAVSYA